MTIGLVLLTALMAVIVGWLFRQTIHVQPWQAQVAVPGMAGGRDARPTAKAALWVFLAVATSLFVLFVSAYAMRLGLADWSPLPRPRLLMLNTALLVGASLAMQWTVHAARRAERRRRAARPGRQRPADDRLPGRAAGRLEAAERRRIPASRPVPPAPSSTCSPPCTACTCSVAWWPGRAPCCGCGAASDPAAIRLGVELCATYWHFLLAVWVVLYALLVSNDLGLAICSSAPL